MSAGDDCDGQRYSADPTVFLGERNQKTTDEDGYMSPMNKSASGKIKKVTFKIHLAQKYEEACACRFWVYMN